MVYVILITVHTVFCSRLSEGKPSFDEVPNTINRLKKGKLLIHYDNQGPGL